MLGVIGQTNLQDCYSPILNLEKSDFLLPATTNQTNRFSLLKDARESSSMKDKSEGRLKNLFEHQGNIKIHNKKSMKNFMKKLNN